MEKKDLIEQKKRKVVSLATFRYPLKLASALPREAPTLVIQSA